MNRVTTVLAIIAVLALLVFALQNLEAVEIQFLVWKSQISKCILMIASFLLGGIAGIGMLELRKFFQG